MNFQWTTQYRLLGIGFDVDLANVPKLNYDKKLVKIKNIINQWTKRHTTSIGRISLIKSLLKSQIIHLFISLPTPPNINDLNNLLYYVYNLYIHNHTLSQVPQRPFIFQFM